MKKSVPPGEIVAVLHDIRSIHNVGSIFRTADAAGMRKIYLCGITPGPLDRFGRLVPQFGKVSLGAERFVEWEKTASTVRLLGDLKEKGYAIFAVEQAKGSIPYFKAANLARGRKVALVLGNEVKGIPKAILGRADKAVEIPMSGKKESLNVSVAFGIIAFALRDGALL